MHLQFLSTRHMTGLLLRTLNGYRLKSSSCIIGVYRRISLCVRLLKLSTHSKSPSVPSVGSYELSARSFSSHCDCWQRLQGTKFFYFLQWISVDQWGSGVPGADKAVCFLVCHLLSASLLPLVLIILFIVVTDKFEP